ncbi:aminotransferase class V-fold PLP-dependent enzyme [Bacillaceae bacterium S4-13-58]
MKNINEIRKSFPILKNKIQLSSCSQSAMHIDVKRAIDEYVENWAYQGMNWGKWMEECEQARSNFAKMINADPNEVAIVSSVSHAISSIATSLNPTSGKNKVRITDFDFPTVGHVWLSHSDKFEVEFLEQSQVTGDSINTLDNKTLLVSTSHVNFYNGHKQDLRKIAEKVIRIMPFCS